MVAFMPEQTFNVVAHGGEVNITSVFSIYSVSIDHILFTC